MSITLVENENPIEDMKGIVLDTCLRLDEFRVTDTTSYTLALEACGAGKALITEIKSKFAPRKKLAKAAHDALCSWENDEVKPIIERVEKLSREALSWKGEQKRLSDAKLAEDQAKARRDAEDRQIAQAARLETLGETKKAEAVMARPVLVPVVMPREAEMPQVSGASFRSGFDVEIIDIEAFLRFVGENPGQNGYLVTPNLSALKAVARAQKSSFAIPGCVLRTTETLVQRAR